MQTIQQAADEAARAVADDLDHPEVIAYHYNAAAARIYGILRVSRPTPEMQRLAQIMRACEVEAKRRTESAPGYGTAG